MAQEVSRRVDELRHRREDDVGRIERHRHVVGNASVLAGTRIPTSVIWNFHEAGYSTDQVIEEYPRLSPEDVRAAIAYEQERRAS